MSGNQTHGWCGQRCCRRTSCLRSRASRQFDNVLKASKTKVDILIRFTGRVCFTQFRDLASVLPKLE